MTTSTTTSPAGVKSAATGANSDTKATMAVVDWGLVGYEEAHRRQRALMAERQRGEGEDTLVFCEHPHVITVGRSRAAVANVLAPGDVEVVSVERGGDVTYHGPGQLVAYPVLRLETHERDLHGFLRSLENGIIATLSAYGLAAGREPGKTGVWIDGRKLASIGIACRRWVTFHGLALNVTTDLSYFARINPCGFAASVMTSMARELDRDAVDMEEVKARLTSDLAAALGRVLRPMPSVR